MLNEFRSQRIIWDKANNNVYEKIEAHAGDTNGRKLVVQVINSGVVEDLTGASLSLAWKGRDNVGLDAFTDVDLEKGLFEIYYTTEMLTNVGILKASLVLIDVNGRIESKSFDIHVNKSNVDDEAVQSENSFTALTEALVKVSQYQAEIDDIKQDIVNQGNTLITQQGSRFDNLYSDKETDLENLKQEYVDKAETLETTYAPRLTHIEEKSNEHATQLAEQATELNNLQNSKMEKILQIYLFIKLIKIKD